MFDDGGVEGDKCSVEDLLSMAHAGDKRRHSNTVADTAILRRWGDDTVKWIWGLRDDSDLETRVRAEALLAVSGKIICNGCGNQYKSHKGDFNEHLATDTCTIKRGKGFRFDELGNDRLLRCMAPVTAVRERHHETVAADRLMFLNAFLLGNGIGYKKQETLFNKGSPVLRALIAIGPSGVGGRDTTVTRNTSKAIIKLEHDFIRPLMRKVVDLKLPMAILMDGSAHKGGGVGDAELVGV